MKKKKKTNGPVFLVLAHVKGVVHFSRFMSSKLEQRQLLNPMIASESLSNSLEFHFGAQARHFGVPNVHAYIMSSHQTITIGHELNNFEDMATLMR